MSDVRPTTMYIEKDILNKFDDVRSCHICTSGNFNLNFSVMPNGELIFDRSNIGSLNFASFKDVDGYKNGKPAEIIMTNLTVDLNNNPEFEALFNALASKFITDESSPFKDGLLLDSEDEPV